jgi:hypothetical protein
VLALALGGCTIAELQERMSQRELQAWREFYRLYPFDDRHRFHRPAAALARAIGGQGITTASIIEWLQPDPRNVDLTSADLATLQAFGFKAKAH